MEDEILLTVDADNKPVFGASRGQVLSGALWRRAAGGLIIDPSTREVLCHKRSTEKDERPGRWVATFGGKVRQGESVAETAERELFEEFGIMHEIVSSEEIIHKSPERHQFEYVFLVCIEKGRTVVRPQNTEVTECTWLSFVDAIDNLSISSEWYAYGYETKIIRSVTDR